MAATGTQTEAGYAKIFRWLEFQFRQMTREAQLEVSPAMQEAMKRLAQRPAMRTEALSVLTATRSAAILQSFLDALTRGGPNGLPRPIEIHAHDPTRYVGDMLAWIHQATANEHETLESLFGIRGHRMVGAARNPSGSEAGRLVSEVLDRNLEGLGRPLKLRIEQTIKSQEGIIMTYRIVNLLQFYLVTMRKTIGEDAQLVKTLHEWVMSLHADPDCTPTRTRRSSVRSKHRGGLSCVSCIPQMRPSRRRCHCATCARCCEKSSPCTTRRSWTRANARPTLPRSSTRRSTPRSRCASAWRTCARTPSGHGTRTCFWSTV